LASKSSAVALWARSIPQISSPLALADLAQRGIDTLVLDVDDPGSAREAVEQVLCASGRIDMLINNAGFLLAGPVAELPLVEIQHQLQTNVVGPVAVAQAAIPLMVRQRARGASSTWA
jgi:NAD(P)-dependent dehydrogenase (short-subunit alcohol dehydrogenase family)